MTSRAWAAEDTATEGDDLVRSLREAGVLDEADRIYDALERGEDPLNTVDTDEMIATLRLRHPR